MNAETPNTANKVRKNFIAGHGFLVSAEGSDSEHEGKVQRFSPNSLRHGYAYRGALTGIPLRQLAPSMGHDVRTNMKH